MLRIIRFLITGVWAIHEHEFEEVENWEITFSGRTVGKAWLLRCKCGETVEHKVEE